jgi:hypothetical protein
MRSGLRCARLFLARSADYPTPLIRPFITSSIASSTRKPVAYSTTSKLTFRKSARTFSMSSSADQAQPDRVSTSASAEAPVAEAAGSSTAAKMEPELPPLSPQEFRAYNRLAETMDYFVCSMLSEHYTSTGRRLTLFPISARPLPQELEAFIYSSQHRQAASRHDTETIHRRRSVLPSHPLINPY